MLFEQILFSGTVICLAVIMYCRYVRPEISTRVPEPWYLDWARSFFPVFLIVFLLRGFVAEPFRIPSGSMLPTLEVGDFILVNKYAYGVRLPIVHSKVLDIGDPQRGDIVVFRYPPDGKTSYIKRLVGLPGDELELRGTKLLLNGEPINAYADGDYQVLGEVGQRAQELQLLPRDDGFAEFNAIYHPRRSNRLQSRKIVVPEGQYFMMGDNRDNSLDSRSWGFVPDENIVGRAFFVWMHYNTNDGGGFKGSRIGTSISPNVISDEDVDVIGASAGN
ncbi:MAG: signal peptidase I [Pseudomonadota bacterium]